MHKTALGLTTDQMTSAVMRSFNEPVYITVPDPRESNKNLTVGVIRYGLLTWYENAMDYYLWQYQKEMIAEKDNSPALGGQSKDNSPMLGGDRREHAS